MYWKRQVCVMRGRTKEYLGRSRDSVFVNKIVKWAKMDKIDKNRAKRIKYIRCKLYSFENFKQK